VFCSKSLALPLCCRKLKVSKITERGPQKTCKEKAFGGTEAEDTSRRRCASYNQKAAASSPARVSVLLKAL
jgi:hypothetical protein